MKPRLLALTFLGLALASCESLPPISAAYFTHEGGPKFVAVFSSKAAAASPAPTK
jgi:hypothetical protein